MGRRSSTIAILFVFALSGLFIRQAPSAQAASNNLAAYWNFDESTAGSAAADSSGNGNDLTPTNSPVPSTDISSAMNQGIADSHSASFDGSSQYFSVADNSSFDDPSAVSISTWVKFNSVSGNQTIVAKWQVGVNQQWVLQAMGNKITWWTGNGVTGGVDELISNANVTTGTWYHLVATATNGAKNLYINGTLDNTNAAGSMGLASGTPISVASKQSIGGGYFEYLSGNVDDTRVYSRVLNATEASSLAAGNESITLTGGSAVTNESGTTSAITDLQVAAGTASDSTTAYVKLYVGHGTISLGTTTGLTFYNTNGSSLGNSQPTNSAVLHIGGSISNLNTALATLQYTHTDTGTGTDDLQASLVQPGQVFFSGNSHLYQYVAGPVTWTAAKAAADASTKDGAQGYLATITSQDENDFILTQLQSDSWIGASDAASEGNWIWADGPENGQQFWSGGGNGNIVNGMYAHWNNPTTGGLSGGVEPNNVGNNENCAEFYYSVGGANNGLWNDEPCTYNAPNLGYIIEYGAPGALPTVATKDVTIATVDTTAPSKPGAPTASSPTSDTTPAVNWSASNDDGSGLANPAYTLEWSTSSTFATTSGSATTNSTTLSPSTSLADGAWYFRVIATDNSINTTTSDISNPVIVDTTIPNVPSASPVGGNYNSTQTITLAATDNTNGSGVNAIYYTTNGAQPTSSSTQYTSPITVSSSETLKAIAYDNAGNSGPIMVEGYTIDTQAPDAPGKPVVAPGGGNTPTVGWTAAHDNGDSGLADPTYTLEWSFNADFSSVDGSATTNDTTYTFPTSLSDGTRYFRVRATDNAGNTATSAASDPLIIDTTGPTKLGQPIAALHVTSDTTPDISWTAAQDKGSGLADPAYKLEWSLDQTFATGISSLTTNSTSVTIPASLSTGKWWLHLTATDNAGNTFTTGNSVIIDITAPDEPAASPAGGTYTSTQTVLLSSADNLVSPDIYYTTDGSTPTSSSTQFHDATTPVIISSSKTLKAIAYDSVGNVSPIMTETYVITAKTTTPSTPHQPTSAKTSTTNSAAAGTSPSTGQLPPTESATGKTSSQPQTSPPQTNENDQTTLPTVHFENDADNTRNPDTKNIGAFLGLGWWWLLVTATIATFFWWLIAARRRKHSVQQ